MITLEALDDLLQAAATASANLRRAVSDQPSLAAMVASADSALSSVNRADLSSAAATVRSALNSLVSVAGKIGDTSMVQTLNAKMSAAGLGTNWFVILGLGAGAIAAYFLWQHYGRKAIATFSRPDPAPRDLRPQLRGMHKALGGFSSAFGGRRLGSGPKRRSMGGAEKYEFEPEIRLEGMRRKARSKR